MCVYSSYTAETQEFSTVGVPFSQGVALIDVLQNIHWR